MKNIKKWLAAVMLIMMLILTAACGNDTQGTKAGYRTLEEIKTAGVINIGVFSD